MKGVAKGLDRASKGMNGFNNLLQDSLTKLGLYGAAAAAAFTVLGTAIGAAWKAFKAYTDQATKIKDGARSAQMSRKEYAELSYVSQRTGVAIETMVSAVNKMTEAIQKAKKGNEEYIDFFNQLGLSIADVEKMKPAQMMEAVAKAANRLNLNISDIPRSS